MTTQDPMTTRLVRMPVDAPAEHGEAQPDGAPTSPGREGQSVRLVRSELLKIWTTSTWWIFGILLVAGTGLTLLINLFSANKDLTDAVDLKARGLPNLTGADPATQELIRSRFAAETDLHRILVNVSANVFTSGQYIGLLFATILGCLMVTNEFHHQTATTTFLATPRRGRVILGKVAAGALFGIVFWLITTVVDVVVGALYFSRTGRDVALGDWTVLRSMLMNLVAYMIWVVLGITVGVMVRGQLGAVITAAVAYIPAIPVAALFFEVVRQYMITDDSVFKAMVLVPGVDSQIMVSPERVPLGLNVVGPPWWVGLILLIAYGVAAGVVGMLLTRRRDIS